MTDKHPLDEASAAILERLAKEQERAPTTAHSHLVGGIAFVGSKLDDFLRALLQEVAGVAGRQPTEFLPVVGTRTVSLRKASAGQLLHAVAKAAAGQTLHANVRACVDDALSRRSVFGAVITLRNDAVHQTILPKDANATLKRLSTLLHAYRREAGWND